MELTNLLSEQLDQMLVEIRRTIRFRKIEGENLIKFSFEGVGLVDGRFSAVGEGISAPENLRKSREGRVRVNRLGEKRITDNGAQNMARSDSRWATDFWGRSRFEEDLGSSPL